jgi:hypothetical protein
MHPLSEIPDFVKLEHETAKILQRQEALGWRFDVAAARQLTSILSKKNFKRLNKYFKRGTLSSKAQNSIRKEITKHKDMYLDAHPLASSR